MSFRKKLWIGLILLALASPVGIILPDKFNAGDAWGEWDADKLKEMLGFVPRNLAKLSGLWHAPMPDYGFAENASPAIQYVGYITSGILGIALAGSAIYFISKLLFKKGK